MGEIFLKLLNMSITASWIILAIRYSTFIQGEYLSGYLFIMGCGSNQTDISVLHRSVFSLQAKFLGAYEPVPW